MFFQLLMLNISSIKELLHKPSEIQWNITETLPGKLKRKIYWAFSCKILSPEITKTWEIAIFWGTLGAWDGISESFSLYLLVRNNFNLKLGFFTYPILQGVLSEKNILRQHYHSAMLMRKSPEKPSTNVR